MNLIFSDKPGKHERHLRRKVNNPLFCDSKIHQEAILKARGLDTKEFDEFMIDFHALAKDASQIDANADSKTLYVLKQRLDNLYERSCGLMGKHEPIKLGLKDLIESIMNTLGRAVIDNAPAAAKLEEEKKARNLHFALLEHKLIVDILCKDSLITDEDLVPSMLTDSIEAACAAAGMLTAEQRLHICKKGIELLKISQAEPSIVEHGAKVLQAIEQMNVSPSAHADGNGV